MKKYCNKMDYIQHEQKAIKNHNGKLHQNDFKYFLNHIIGYKNQQLSAPSDLIDK
jgi:hypothetical protein